jgi:nitroimidazol reductase NimA-like FMN-containing flavoprotein (pyridoxamine 5'-phosphate oxidase superfamily)
MFGKLTSNEIEEVLGEQVVGHLGCHANGVTYVVPVSYAYDGKFLYGRSMEGMKIDFMRKNPIICFQVDIMRDMANWKSIILWGEFEELKDPKTRSFALQKLIERKLPLVSSATTHLSSTWPFPEQNPANIKGIVFRILIKEKTGRFESGPLAGSIDEYR